MYLDSKPLIDQVSWDGFCNLYGDNQSVINIVYGNPLMDFVPTVADIKDVLNDPKVQHLPVKRKRS